MGIASGDDLKIQFARKIIQSLGLLLLSARGALAQEAHPQPAPPPLGAKAVRCKGRPVPQLEDITKKMGIHFFHNSSPESKYIVESMSGGVILIDYDRDGWPDIYFTNAPTVEASLKGQKARSALYHNNHDGTFTDVTDKAGVATPCFAMGGAVGDYNHKGLMILFLTASLMIANNLKAGSLD